MKYVKNVRELTTCIQNKLIHGNRNTRWQCTCTASSGYCLTVGEKGVGCHRCSVGLPLHCYYTRRYQTAVEREHCWPRRHAYENLTSLPSRKLSHSSSDSFFYHEQFGKVFDLVSIFLGAPLIVTANARSIIICLWQWVASTRLL